MKIRSGFVSNSSSSSFLVAFPHVPKDVEDLQKIIFKEDEFFLNPYYDEQYSRSEDESWSAREIAERLFRNFPSECTSEEEMLDCVNNGYYDGRPDNHYPPSWRELSQEQKDAWYEYEDKRLLEASKECLERFLDVAHGVLGKDCPLYVFEFSDNKDAMEGAMEHGRLFRHMLHLHVSNH